MKKFSDSLPSYITVIFALCAAILFGNAFSLYDNLKTLRRTNASIEHAWDIKDNLKYITVLIMDAESSTRGYFLTGDKVYLGPVKTAKDRIESEFKALSALLASNPAQMKYLGQLQTLFAGKIRQLDQSIAAFDSGGLGKIVAQARQAKGIDSLDEIRLLVVVMEREENELLAARSKLFYDGYRKAVMVGMVINGIAVLVLILFYRLIKRNFYKRLSVEQKLQRTNDNLEANVLARTEQLSVLSRHLINVAEEEKAKLARELHDELGSNLTVIAMDIAVVADKLTQFNPELASRLRRAISTLKETVNLKRRLIENLRPSMLDNMGLSTALREHAQEFGKISGLRVHANICEEFDEINSAPAIALFRIAQEALTNAAKYAQATQVWVSLQAKGDGLSLQVVDDGIGIAPDALNKPKSHGLSGMRERILLLGGGLTVRQVMNGHGGTSVEAYLPLKSIPDHDCDLDGYRSVKSGVLRAGHDRIGVELSSAASLSGQSTGA
ncbi:MAG TPA: histidine kinase [Oxalobacteraceae bacterium]|jgi:signal transduction histidine kinase|nr:histidine kinase [Oxalobacteraceae bacterium]